MPGMGAELPDSTCGDSNPNTFVRRFRTDDLIVQTVRSGLLKREHGLSLLALLALGGASSCDGGRAGRDPGERMGVDTDSAWVTEWQMQARDSDAVEITSEDVFEAVRDSVPEEAIRLQAPLLKELLGVESSATPRRALAAYDRKTDRLSVAAQWMALRSILARSAKSDDGGALQEVCQEVATRIRDLAPALEDVNQTLRPHGWSFQMSSTGALQLDWCMPSGEQGTTPLRPYVLSGAASWWRTAKAISPNFGWVDREQDLSNAGLLAGALERLNGPIDTGKSVLLPVHQVAVADPGAHGFTPAHTVQLDDGVPRLGDVPLVLAPEGSSPEACFRHYRRIAEAAGDRLPGEGGYLLVLRGLDRTGRRPCAVKPDFQDTFIAFDCGSQTATELPGSSYPGKIPRRRGSAMIAAGPYRADKHLLDWNGRGMTWWVKGRDGSTTLPAHRDADRDGELPAEVNSSATEILIHAPDRTDEGPKVSSVACLNVDVDALKDGVGGYAPFDLRIVECWIPEKDQSTSRPAATGAGQATWDILGSEMEHAVGHRIDHPKWAQHYRNFAAFAAKHDAVAETHENLTQRRRPSRSDPVPYELHPEFDSYAGWTHAEILHSMATAHGVPTWLAVGLNAAESRAKVIRSENSATAKGPWQFIRSTAKLVGLIKGGRDYRCDYAATCEAAMKSLARKHASLGYVARKDGFSDQVSDADLWRWASLGYNASPRKIMKLFRKSRGDLTRYLEAYSKLRGGSFGRLDVDQNYKYLAKIQFYVDQLEALGPASGAGDRTGEDGAVLRSGPVGTLYGGEPPVLMTGDGTRIPFERIRVAKGATFFGIVQDRCENASLGPKRSVHKETAALIEAANPEVDTKDLSAGTELWVPSRRLAEPLGSV